MRPRVVVACLPPLFAACMATSDLSAPPSLPHFGQPAATEWDRDWRIETRAHYGIPILQRAIAWDGNGEVDNFGVGVRGYKFLSDELAVGAGLEGTAFENPRRTAYGGEIETVARWYPALDDDVLPFVELTGGYVQTNHDVPPGGTQWNFTFSFGPGLEIPIAPHESLLFESSFHHMSNARGRDNPRNPSQNEVRIWVGFGWDF